MKKYLTITIALSLMHLNAEINIEDCASIKSDSKRLACYDYLITGSAKASEELQNYESNDQEAIAGKRNIVRESSFGLLNRQKDRPQSSQNKKSLSSSIEEVTETFGGKARFKLSNDQLWETQSVVKSQLGSFKVKTKIMIEEARMGGFWMISEPSNVRIKVKRVS